MDEKNVKKSYFFLGSTMIVIVIIWLLEIIFCGSEITHKFELESIYNKRVLFHSGLLFICGISFLIIMFRRFDKYTGKKMPILFSSLIWAGLTLVGVEFLSCSGSVYQLRMNAIGLNLLLLLLILNLFYSILGNLFFSSIFINTILFITIIINYYTMQFRGTVIVPSDIFAIGTAMNVAGNYEFTLNIEFIVFAAYLVSACGFLALLNQKKKRKIGRIWCSVLLIAAVVCLLNITSIKKFLKIGINDWKPTMQCQEEGFLLTFLDSISKGMLQKPKGYSVEQVDRLCQQYETEPIDYSRELEKPNVIVIMNESFADLEEFEQFSASESLQPFLYSLRDKENTFWGYVQVPVMGGGTSNTEFEFLTGINNGTYYMNAPYDSIVSKELDALPRVMKKLGYNSVALHPEIGANWSRNKGYPKLGFETFIDITKIRNRETIRNYISDISFYKEIIELDKEIEEPLFLFGVTMQNHGGYEEKNFNMPIKIQSPEGDYPLTTQYINLVRESDRAFEEFISYYEEQEEPTVIVFFGDHFPRIESEILNTLIGSVQTGTFSDELLLYHTPYYIWANYEIDKSMLPEEGEMISVSFLQSLIMNVAQLPKTGYQDFLLNMTSKYPVVTGNCILNADNELVLEQNNKDLEAYAIMQYLFLKNQKMNIIGSAAF